MDEKIKSIWDRIAQANDAMIAIAYHGNMAAACRWARLTAVETAYVLAYKALEDITL